MATLGGYAQRQSQTASAADTTLQALMMLMQYQQQAEDRRLSREQMQLQNQQLQGLLRAQQREEVAQAPGTTAIRNISDVENQSVYSRLDQTITSLNTFMDNPELASDPMLNADLGLSPAVRSMQSGSPEEYAKVIRVLNTQLQQVQSMIDNSEVPAKEAERFMEGLRGRIKSFANNVSEGVKFQQAYLQVLSEDNARGERGADGELISASVENPEILIPDDPLIELDPATVNSFGKQAVEAGIRKVSESVVDAAIKNLPEEDARTLQQQIEKDPSLIDTIGLAGNATEAIEDIIGNIPPAQESVIDQAINFAKESPGTAAVGTLGAGYGAFKLWPLLRQSPAVAASLTGAELLGRAGQEQGLLPGEGVFVGEDSMLQGSMRDISRAQELQERLPADQRVGPIEGVLRGMGEAAYDALGLESLFHPMGPFGGFGAADPALQTAAAPAEGVIEKEVVRRDLGAEIPEQVTLEDLVAPAPPARDFSKTVAREGETVQDIAERVYGSRSSDAVNRIVEANTGLDDLVKDLTATNGDFAGLVLKIPYEESYDRLDIEMQPTEIPAQADPGYIDYLTNLQFQASMQKAEEANRELAALVGLARETSSPDFGISASGDVVESLEARQRRMAQTNEPARRFDPALMEGLEGSLGTALDMPVGRRRERETTDSMPAALDLPVGGRSKAAEGETTEPVDTQAALASLQDFVPFDEKEYQRRQLVADVLNQTAINNMLQATKQEAERQALMEQVAIEQLLQSTPNTGANLSFNPSTQMPDQSLMSLYALMGQPF